MPHAISEGTDQNGVRSDDLTPADQLARINEALLNSLHPTRVTSDDAEDFHATARTLDLAAVDVVKVTSSTSDIKRTPKLIRNSDPEFYTIVLPLSGRLVVAQGEHQAALGDRDLALYSSSRPFHMHIAAGRGTATLLRTELHRALLPLPARRIDRLLAVRMSGREGMGALLTQFLTQLTTDSTPYRPADFPRLGAVAIDLLTGVLAHHQDADDAPPSDSDRPVLLLRIKAFVHRHLPDPELSPQTIAAAHHISVSYVHRLFQAHGTTVSAWIRSQRLERARRDLTDPTRPCGACPSTGSRPAGDSTIMPLSRARSAPPTACHPGTTAITAWDLH